MAKGAFPLIAAPWTRLINGPAKINTRPFSVLECRPMWVTMSTCVCGPIRKPPHGDHKQRSMPFCRRPCSRRVCACVCALGVGRAGITQLSFGSGHIYAFGPSGRPKPLLFSPRVCIHHSHIHILPCPSTHTCHGYPKRDLKQHKFEF